MARGRMLNKRISLNKIVNSLSDRSQLIYTWTIAHLDKNGVIHGDPALLKSLVVPRRPDIDTTQVEVCIKEWADVGLVIWYEHEDELWLWFPTFKKNQIGLREDREADTGNPVYGDNPDSFRMLSGVTPAMSPECIPPNEWNERNGSINKGIELTSVGGFADGSPERAAVNLFQQRDPIWPNQAEHIEAIRELVKLASNRGDPSDVLPPMIALFIALVDGTKPGMSKSEIDFWGKHPPLPKRMVGMWESLEGVARQIGKQGKEHAVVNKFLYGDLEDEDVDF